jgi:hypothetical protein
MIPAADFRGKRVRFSAALKSEGVERSAGLWMRVDVKEKSVAFDNMTRRPVKGTQPWTVYSVVLDVDPSATNIVFGMLLSGKGALWLDGARLEEVSREVPVTDMMKPPSGPRNLGFDEQEAR